MRASWGRLQSLRGSRVARHTTLVYLAQLTQAAIGFGTSLLLIRQLSVDDYGAFSIFISIFMMLAGLSHWGWTDTFVRFGSLHRQGPHYAALERFFRGRVTTLSLASALLLAIAAYPIAQRVYGRADWSSLLLWAAAAGFFTCQQSFETNRVRVFQRFGLYFAASAGASIFRFLALLGLWFAGALLIQGVAMVYTASALLAVAAIWLVFRPASSAEALDPALRAETRQYNRWLLLSILATTLITNIDVHFVAYFAGSSSAAQLGAASRLTLPISMLVSAVTTTILPRLSESQGDRAFVAYYLRQLRFLLPLLALGFGVLGAAAVPLLAWLAGAKYAGLEPLLLLQLASILVVLITNPFGLLLAARARTKQLACMNGAQLVVSLVLHALITSRWGAIGAVCVTIFVNTIGLVTVLALVKAEESA